MGLKPRPPIYFDWQRAQYFESGARFWEVAQDGISVQVRHGPIGAAGRTDRERHATVAEAIDRTGQMIADKQRGGYRPVAVPVPARRRVSFEEPASAARRPITRWGGLPSRGDDRDWPVCGWCGAALSFVFQACAGQVPLFGRRALQFFACLAGDCAIYDPRAPSIEVRLFDTDLAAETVDAPAGTRVLPDRVMALAESPEPPRPGDDVPYEPAHSDWFDEASGDKFYGTPATGSDLQQILCPICNRWQRFAAQFQHGPMDGYEDWFQTVVLICPSGHSASIQGVR